MTLLALIAKISLPPVLVALMSMAARRWGPTFGGLIMGLPWMTGPVLFFLGLDKGQDFLVSSTRGAELAVWGMAPYILCFGYASKRFGWLGSLVTAIAGYAAAGLVTQALDVPLWLATAGAILALLATYHLLPMPRAPAAIAPAPKWDIAARMVATLFLVSLIMITADRLGPQRSGIISSFPVIMTVIGAFTLHQSGHDALLRVLRGISLSLLTFTGFFAVVGFMTPAVGQYAAFALAAATALSISATLIAWSRRPVMAKAA